MPKVYKILNMPKNPRVIWHKDIKADAAGRVPVWNIVDKKWQLIAVKWLQIVK